MLVVSFRTQLIERSKYMDKYKLEYEMKRRGITAKQLYEAMGISASAWNRKFHGKVELTLSEIQFIVDYLGLESPVGIFFTDKVS